MLCHSVHASLLSFPPYLVSPTLCMAVHPDAHAVFVFIWGWGNFVCSEPQEGHSMFVPEHLVTRPSGTSMLCTGSVPSRACEGKHDSVIGC
jgi:hypothetical protein